MSDQYKITDEQKNLLLQISAQTLPDNPSRDGYSAETIRKRLYKPYAALVDLINDVFNSAYSDVDGIITGKTTVENANTAQTADKVSNALTLSVNGETTTFDGSTAKKVNIKTSGATVSYNQENEELTIS